jgi:hypothetical protein
MPNGGIGASKWNHARFQEKFAWVVNVGQKPQSVACNAPPALHGCLTGKMQAPWRPPKSFPSGILGTFGDQGCPGTCPVACTRLKKMQATACIKIGSFCEFLRNWREIAFSPECVQIRHRNTRQKRGSGTLLGQRNRKKDGCSCRSSRARVLVCPVLSRFVPLCPVLSRFVPFCPVTPAIC